MGNTITIQVDALTEAAGAKIEGFFKKIDLSARALNKSLATDPQAFFAQIAAADARAKGLGAAAEGAGKRLSMLGSSAMGTTSAMRLMNDVVLLTGGTRLRELSYAMMGAGAGMRLLRSAATLTGLSLGTLVPVIGGIAAAVGAGALLWNDYSNSLKKTEERAKAAGKSLEEMPALLEKISSAKEAGLITPRQAQKWTDTLGLTAPAGSSTNSVFSPYSSISKIGSGWGMPTATFQDKLTPRTPADPEAMAQVQKEMQKAGLLTANNARDPQSDALERLAELKKKIALEALAGIEKEKAKTTEAYESALSELNKLAAQAGQRYSPEELAEQKEGLTAAYNSQIFQIEDKKRDEDNKKAMEAEAKADEEASHRATRERKLLEDQLTLLDLEAGKKRGNNYEAEFDKRMALYDKQFKAEAIGEEEFLDLAAQASIKKQEGINKEKEDTNRLIEAEAELNLARVQGARKLIESDPDLSRADKKEKLLEKMREEKRLLEENLVIYERMVRDPSLTAEGKISAVRKVEDIQQRLAANKQDTAKTASSGTFGGEMKHSLKEMSDQYTNLAHEIATTLTSVIGSAIDTISKGITGLIMGTKTWGQALREIGTSILNQVINAIISMFLKWIIGMLAAWVVGEAITKATNTEAATSAAAWAPAATLASIASYGAAAAVGTAAVIAGLAVTEAFSAGMSGAGGAFAEGGRPPVGLMSLVGERGPELFIPDVPGTILPADETSAFLRHSGGRNVQAGKTTLKNDNRISFSIHDDRRSALDAMNSAEGRRLYVRLGKEHRHEIHGT